MGKGSIKKRRNWRNKAFSLLTNKDLNDIERGKRSDVLRNVLKTDKEKDMKKCLFCNKVLKDKQLKYCSKMCGIEYRKSKKEKK